MARYLFCVFGASGHLHPLIPAAKILLRDGHEVGFLTAPSYEMMLTHLGFRYFKPSTWNASLTALKAPPQSRNLWRNIRELLDFSKEVSFPEGEKQVNDLLELFDRWPFDVLVSSDMILGASVFSELRPCAWATHGAFLSAPLAGPSVPPWGIGLRPARNLMERIREHGLSFVHRKIFTFLAKDWNRVRTKFHLPERSTPLFEQLLSPSLYIVPSPARFDYSRLDRGGMRHVGACLWEEESGQEWPSPFGDTNPIVYFTAGTFYNSLDFLRLAIESFRGRPANLFATIGKNNSVESLGKLPPNVRVVQYLPQHLILRRSSAVLCTGGSGVTMAAILAKKPLVIVPMISDQPENARRCEALGVAKVLPLKHLNPERLWNAIDGVLNDASFRKRAEFIGGEFAAEDGPAVAARLLEELPF